MTTRVQRPRPNSGPKERERWEHEISKRLDATYGITDLAAMIAQAETRDPVQVRRLFEQLALSIPEDQASRIHRLEDQLRGLEKALSCICTDARILRLINRIADLEKLICCEDGERIDILEQKVENLEKGVL